MRATVAILAYNAEPWVRQQLEALREQRADFDWEILFIDSGSTDGTLEAIQNFPEIRLHQILNSEFGHGKTRNLAAKLAKGEVVVFITQDAIPENKDWLSALLQPFERPEVVCVFGRQIPRPDCCPTVKRDVIQTFRGFGPDHRISYQQRDDPQPDQAAEDRLRFFSDVNSAVRRDFLLDVIPYRDLAYAEDQAFGRDVIGAGYIKAYAPEAAVIHSHSYSLFKYFRRMYDEMAGLKQSTGQTLDTGLILHGLIASKQTLKDWQFITRDRDYGPLTKLKWLVLAPFYQLARRVAIRLANGRSLPRWAEDFFSLEARGKR